jgi:actin-related protein
MTNRYANGKATALVVDIGHQQSSVTAVWEGMVLKKSKCRHFVHSLNYMMILNYLTTVDIAFRH